MIGLFDYLVLASLLFLLSLVGIAMSRNNLVALLICIEVLLLSVNTVFVAASHALGDIAGAVMVLFVLTVAAAETAIGLALFILLFRAKKSVDLQNWGQLKG